MSLCVKTGADVWVSSHQRLIHCDAYYVPGEFHGAGCYVFRYVGESLDNGTGSANITVDRARAHFLLMDATIGAQQRILYLDTMNVIVAPYDDVMETM
jgi:hypothetical protein